MNTIRLFAITALSAACAACTPPSAPPTDKPPEPQASELRDAIQQPIEKARDVEKMLQDAADTQRAGIDAES